MARSLFCTWPPLDLMIDETISRHLSFAWLVEKNMTQLEEQKAIAIIEGVSSIVESKADHVWKSLLPSRHVNLK